MNSSVTIRRDGDASLLVAEQRVDAPLEAVYRFFGDPHNLERITPAFLNFRVLSIDTPVVRPGTLIRYRLKLHGVPIGWTTLIQEWSPPYRFRDVQLEGPYRLWDHLHEFEPVDGGTLLRDRVRFRTPLDALRRTPLLSWVDRDVERIFRYRQSVIAEILGAPSTTSGTPTAGDAVSSIA
jgi:ligand-binding SRPBCC domain-containing protein